MANPPEFLLLILILLLLVISLPEDGRIKITKTIRSKTRSTILKTCLQT